MVARSPLRNNGSLVAFVGKVNRLVVGIGLLQQRNSNVVVSASKRLQRRGPARPRIVEAVTSGGHATEAPFRPAAKQRTML